MIMQFTLLMIGHIICLLFTVTKKKNSHPFFLPFFYLSFLPLLSLSFNVKCFLKNKATFLDSYL